MTIWLKRIGLILLIIFLGTIIDYFVHQLSENFTEQFSYFTHKIAFGTLWAFIAYLVFRKFIKTPFWLAFTMSGVTSVLLQFFYFINEHELTWVTVFFLFVHFLVFLLPGYYICKKYTNLFTDDKVTK